MLQNVKSVSRDSKDRITEVESHYTSRATSGERKKDPNTSGQRGNSFYNSHRDIICSCRKQ